jgi:formylglycine-generating enzyme required for sulfatase activity
MAGNVLEWTSSEYEAYPYDPDDGREALDAKEGRIMRGGSFSRDSWLARSGYREGLSPDDESFDVGFRVVLPAGTATPIPAPEAGATQVRERDGAAMVYVPAGEFWMGSSDEDLAAVMAESQDWNRHWFASELPQHKVYIDAFWIDQTEVTNAQYRKCVAAGACSPPSQSSSESRDSYYGNPEFDDYPVAYVNWQQAQEYAEWVGGRLCTEAEWEYAARGPDARTYPWGNDPPNDSLLNFDYGVGDTTAVGSYPDGASWCGALDMAGNVWEWVADRHSQDYYASSPDENPLGPDSGELRVVRGGSWDFPPDLARCAARLGLHPDDLAGSNGFRVCVSPIP